MALELFAILSVLLLYDVRRRTLYEYSFFQFEFICKSVHKNDNTIKNIVMVKRYNKPNKESNKLGNVSLAYVASKK